MLNIVTKALALSFIGILFPVHTQGMNEDDDGMLKQMVRYGDECKMAIPPKEAGIFDAGSSAFFKTTGEPEVPLPKSYRALQITYEYLLYEFCDPTLDEKGSRAREESKKNKKYFAECLKFQTQRAFSTQPSFMSLKNQLGYEIEEWLVRRDKECATYKAASTELQRREGLLQKSQSQRNGIRLRNAQQNLNAILAQFVRMHGPREVVIGEREVTAEEIASIKQIIYSKKKPSIIITPRAFYSSVLPVGTSYFKDPKALKVQGFILGSRELPRAYEELKKLVEALDREHKICQSVSEYYNEIFLPKVKGWSTWQIGNWMALSQKIATAQTEIKELIEKKYPLRPSPGKYARDRTTDQGEVLAYLNKDKRGQRIRARLVNVNRSFIEQSDQDHKMSQADHFFARIYRGEDELEADRPKEGCHIGTKYPHPNPVTVYFEKVKTRQYILDEERRYGTRLMWEPTPDDYPLLQPNELALSLKGDQLYCWGGSKGEMRIDIDTLTAEHVRELWFLKHIWPEQIFDATIFERWVSFYCWSNCISIGLQKDVYERLQKNVRNNKGLVPEDRWALLDFLLLKKYISRTRETWAMPKNTQMVEEYPSLSHVLAHKRRWKAVTKEFHKRHDPIITDFCSTSPSELTNGYNIITSYDDLYGSLSLLTLNQSTYIRQELINYNELYKIYERLLSDHGKLLREMYQPFGSYTYIPKAIEFFISEAYVEKPSLLPLTPPSDIILSDASIRDDDLQRKRPTSNGYEYMLYCYLTVDLSNNFLTGVANYHFSQFITTLDLSNNHIQFLKFLSYLPALKILNLSHNMVPDLLVFLNFPTSVDQGCLFVQELNLSDNEIEDVGPLSVLKVLKKLDVSGNKINTLSNLYHADTTSSSYDVVLKEGEPRVVQPLKQMNMSLLISLKANNNALEGKWEMVFPEGLNLLSTLEIKNNTDLIVPAKPFDFFDFFPALQTLKTDIGDEDKMSKHPILIDLHSRSLQSQNIVIKDRLLKIDGEEIAEEHYPLSYWTWLNLSDNSLIGIGSSLDDFFSDYVAKLEISKNMLCSLAFIKGFPNLTYLDVATNQIEDVSPLEACLSLKYLDISTNHVNDLNSLKNHPSLGILKANRNGFQIRWQEILPRLPNLTILEIQGNKELKMDTPGDFKIYFPILNRLCTDFMLNPRDWCNS